MSMWITSYNNTSKLLRITVSKFINFHSVNIYKSNYVNLSLRPPWRIVFFGNDKFSIPSLKELCSEFKQEKLINKLKVVTSAKKKSGNLVHKFADVNELEVNTWPIAPEELEDFHLGIVVSFGHMIPEKIINAFPLGIVNVHASLLPRWRGAAPIIHTLMEGDTSTGVTVMKIEPHKFDIGDIIKQKQMQVPKEITQTELNQKLADLGAGALMETIRTLPDCLENAVPQPTLGVSYAPKIRPSMAKIDWPSMDSKKILNVYRALKDIHPLQCFWDGKIVRLLDVSLLTKQEILESVTEANPLGLKHLLNKTTIPGKVVYNKRENALRIQCRDGNWLVVHSLSMFGKPAMSGREFYNGFLSRLDPRSHIFR